MVKCWRLMGDGPYRCDEYACQQSTSVLFTEFIRDLDVIYKHSLIENTVGPYPIRLPHAFDS